MTNDASQKMTETEANGFKMEKKKKNEMNS